jgi:hypothetical protein
VLNGDWGEASKTVGNHKTRGNCNNDKVNSDITRLLILLTIHNQLQYPLRPMYFYGRFQLQQ